MSTINQNCMKCGSSDSETVNHENNCEAVPLRDAFSNPDAVDRVLVTRTWRSTGSCAPTIQCLTGVSDLDTLGGALSQMIGCTTIADNGDGTATATNKDGDEVCVLTCDTEIPPEILDGENIDITDNGDGTITISAQSWQPCDAEQKDIRLLPPAALAGIELIGRYQGVDGCEDAAFNLIDSLKLLLEAGANISFGDGDNGELVINAVVPEGVAIELEEGIGIDLDYDVGGGVTRYTISIDLCELDNKTKAELEAATDLYFALCMDGQSVKSELAVIRALLKNYWQDGNALVLMGAGTEADPYYYDVQVGAYLEISDGKIHSTIKPGANISIQPDGTISATDTDTNTYLATVDGKATGSVSLAFGGSYPFAMNDGRTMTLIMPAAPSSSTQIGSCLIDGTESSSSGLAYAGLSGNVREEHDPDNIFSLGADRINILKDCLVTGHMQTSSNDGDDPRARVRMEWSNYTGGSHSHFPNMEWVGGDQDEGHLNNFSNARYMPAGSYIRMSCASYSGDTIHFGESSWGFVAV